MNIHRKKALFSLVITALLWSTAGIFIKLIPWNPVSIAGARSGISAIVISIFLLIITKINSKKIAKDLNKSKNISIINKRNIVVILAGSICYSMLVLLFVMANKMTTSANAILLQYTSPIWVIVFSAFFLKEKIKLRDLIAMIAILSGMLLFFVEKVSGGTIQGNLVAILSGVFMGGMVIFLKIGDSNSAIVITILGNILTFFIGIPSIIHEKMEFVPVVCILFLGVFQLGISYALYAVSVRHVSSLEAIFIPFLEPLFNPVWVFIFTGEGLGVIPLIGGVIVLSAVIWHSIGKREINTDIS